MHGMRRELEEARKSSVQRWNARLDRSAYKVDLLAETERIEEENRVRLQSQARRARALESRKEQVKNEIILKALAEESDVEALRREKRLLAEEEKRLRAILDLEKSLAKISSAGTAPKTR
eukprot:tig00000829_g4657.t1